MWKPGVVLRHWDAHHAYRVRLSDGTEVQVPLDDPNMIRRDEDHAVG